MCVQQPSEELPEERRMEIYQALADEQDLYEFTPEQARQRVILVEALRKLLKDNTQLTGQEERQRRRDRR
jgi:hypothetical protein